MPKVVGSHLRLIVHYNTSKYKVNSNANSLDTLYQTIFEGIGVKSEDQTVHQLEYFNDNIKEWILLNRFHDLTHEMKIRMTYRDPSCIC